MDGCPGGKIPMKSSIFEGFVNILLGWSEPILSAKVADFQMWDKILQDDLLIKVGHFFYSPSFYWPRRTHGHFVSLTIVSTVTHHWIMNLCYVCTYVWHAITKVIFKMFAWNKKVSLSQVTFKKFASKINQKVLATGDRQITPRWPGARSSPRATLSVGKKRTSGSSTQQRFVVFWRLGSLQILFGRLIFNVTGHSWSNVVPIIQGQ